MCNCTGHKEQPTQLDGGTNHMDETSPSLISNTNGVNASVTNGTLVQIASLHGTTSGPSTMSTPQKLEKGGQGKITETKIKYAHYILYIIGDKNSQTLDVKSPPFGQLSPVNGPLIKRRGRPPGAKNKSRKNGKGQRCIKILIF